MCPPRSSGAAPLRRFFLARTPEQGQPELLPEDRSHATKVLRMGEGDQLLGLDGRGSAWLLEIVGSDRGRLELREVQRQANGEPESGPGPEVWCSPPRRDRAQDMLDRLTQLGVSAVQFLTCERTPSVVRDLKLTRLERAAREACKQSGRLWLPELREPAPLSEALDEAGARTLWLLDGEAEQRLADQRAKAGVALLVGPEGGFTPEEKEQARSAGAHALRLSSHVLRIETAAEAAAAWFAVQN